MLVLSAAQALERLRKAEAARGGLAEAEALDDLRNQFAALARPIHQLGSTARMLRSEGVAVSTPSELAKPLQTISNTTVRFREKATSSTLKQGKRWANLVDAMTLVGKVREASLHADWKTYVGSHLFSGPPPEEVRMILAKTPSNTNLLRTYESVFRKFALARATLPATRESLLQLREHSSELSRIKFQTDVPTDVRAFFQAVATSEGAGLNLLTESVIAWLRQNHQFPNYVIRARVN